MTTKEYLESVEAKDELHKQLEKGYPIFENDSPLFSLKDVDFPLIYEPSMMPNYQYLVREELIEKIERISAKLQQDNMTLVIRSAWRSFKHQGILWEQTIARMQKQFPDKPMDEIRVITSYYIAPPKKSTHATGAALDALIQDNRTQKILDFGTNDGLKIDLSEKCYPYHPEISQLAKDNRALLIGLFEQEDFICDLKEYWHFDFGNIGWAIEKRKDFAFFGIVGT